MAYRAMNRQAKLDRKFDYFFIEYRQCSGKPHARRACMAIGLGPELCRTAAKYLALGQKMRMDL